MKSARKPDQLFARKLNKVPPFTFDKNVADVFDDMIERSVPLYTEVQKVSAAIASKVCPEQGTVYDLGCSSGTTLIEICRATKDLNLKLIGVDNSKSMLALCATKLKNYGLSDRAKLVCTSLEDFVPGPAHLVCLNYTLMFIAEEQRDSLLKRIRERLLPGGLLILSEKVSHTDKQIHSLINDLHHDFKRSNGYSELEISQKRDALEKVLVPKSLEQNINMLKAAGFKSVDILLKSFNFATLLAKAT